MTRRVSLGPRLIKQAQTYHSKLQLLHLLKTRVQLSSLHFALLSPDFYHKLASWFSILAHVTTYNLKLSYVTVSYLGGPFSILFSFITRTNQPQLLTNFMHFFAVSSFTVFSGILFYGFTTPYFGGSVIYGSRTSNSVTFFSHTRRN